MKKESRAPPKIELIYEKKETKKIEIKAEKKEENKNEKEKEKMYEDGVKERRNFAFIISKKIFLPTIPQIRKKMALSFTVHS